MQDGIDRRLVAMHDIQNARRGTRLHEQFGQPHGQGWIALRGLENKGIARGNRNAEHPHRDHGWEVERGNPGDHAQGLAHGIDVNAGACAFGIFALEQVGNAAGKFDHFQTALNIAFGISNHLAVLAG